MSPTFPDPEGRLWDRFSAVLLLAAALVLFLTLGDYGPTWDEEVQARYGDLILRWYGSGFRDPSVLSYRDLYLYGGLFEVVAQAAARVLPFTLYTSRHVVNGVFGLLGVLGAWRLARRIGGPRAGFLAALFLLATPRFWGHMATNPKDIPFAALAVLYLDAAVASLGSGRPRGGTVLWLGGALGGALAIRVSGLLLPAGLVAGILVVDHEGRIRKIVERVVLPFLVAWPVMLLFWPWAALAPLSRPFEALSALARGGQGWLVLFEGRWVETNNPPASFVPVWFFHTLPDFELVALLALVAMALPGLKRLSRARLAPFCLLLVAVLLPPAAAVVFRSRAYDGARHFLFCVPPLAVLAAVAGSRLAQGGTRGRAVLGLVLGGVVLALVEMGRLHPYESVYFNLATGGLPGAASRFQLDYWGQSYKEGTEWLLAHYHPTDRPRTRPIEVANCSIDFLTETVLEASPRRGEFREVRKRDSPHVLLALRNEECDIPLTGTLLHSVEREGVSLLEIWELRRPS
jgi:4-amino-4-deoxy-L-arabinose transferase-like glycosyltransferase